MPSGMFASQMLLFSGIEDRKYALLEQGAASVNNLVAEMKAVGCS
jgi:hypothetical protein